MTLITRKKIGQEAQMQRQEVRQLRELLEDNRQKGTDGLDADIDCTVKSAELAGLHLVRRDRTEPYV
jgi:hypothetical protein